MTFGLWKLQETVLGILGIRDMASKLLMHTIGDGEGTYLWKDSWHPMGILMDRFPQYLQYNSFLHKNAKVSALIRGGKWDAPAHVQDAIRDIYDDLGAVELDANTQYEIVWLSGQNGEYSSRGTYLAIRERGAQLPWTRLVWFRGRIPRESYITWLAMNKALKTRDKLKRWKQIDYSTCSLCNADSENEEHLFYECWYSRLVWAYILHYMGYNRQPLEWEQEIEWCVQHFTGSSPSTMIKKLCYNATIYHIWQERNRRIFQSKRIVALDLIARIVEDVRLRIAVLNMEIEDTNASRKLCEVWRLNVTYVHKTVTQHSWPRSEPPWYMINSDGSLAGMRGGYGARNNNGEVIAAAAGSGVAKTVLLHEVQGVELGVKLAKNKGLRRTILCMDSANALMYLTTSKPPPWEARHTVRRIKRSLIEFDGYRIMHSVRETNRATDMLAKLVPNTEFLELIPSSFAEDLKKIIYEDAIGK